MPSSSFFLFFFFFFSHIIEVPRSYAKYVAYVTRAGWNSRVRCVKNKAIFATKEDFHVEKCENLEANKKRVTEGRETKRGEVWTSNGTGGMTNQLLVVQLGPHTQHRYYRDHYLSPATPLPRQKGEGTTKSHDARLQIRPPVTAQPLFSMEINRAICLSTIPKFPLTIDNMHVRITFRSCNIRRTDIFNLVF